MTLQAELVGGIVQTCVLAVAIAVLGCKREERGFRVPPSAAQVAELVQVGELRAGQHVADRPVKNSYEENAYALSQGQQLYEAFNCVGCHAHGGGDKGPALMDDRWVYGSNPEQIFASIVEGRPNGMPTFRGKIPEYQVWEIVAYVRSLSGLASKNAAPGREDQMKAAPPPNSQPTPHPKNVTSPSP